MNWEQIVGHADEILRIKAMLQKKHSVHSLLFVGPQGIGKFLVARMTAAAMLCHTNEAELPCGSCESCRSMKNNTHPDLLIIKPDGNSVKIDQIRSLQKEAAFYPTIGKHKVVIIDQADKMTQDAANSILKLLEEPPAYLRFILLSSSLQAILPTVISRCQVLRFKPLQVHLLVQKLIMSGVPGQAAEVAARLSGGRMGQAMHIAEPEGLALRDMAASVLKRLPASTGTILEISAALEKMATSEVGTLLGYLMFLLRDIVMLKNNLEVRLLYNIDLIESELPAMAVHWETEKMIIAVKATQEASRALLGNANVKMTVEALLIKLSDLMRRY